MHNNELFFFVLLNLFFKLNMTDCTVPLSCIDLFYIASQVKSLVKEETFMKAHMAAGVLGQRKYFMISC